MGTAYDDKVQKKFKMSNKKKKTDTLLFYRYQFDSRNDVIVH